MKQETRNMNKSQGYTLLFAVLTAALVLGVAAFILSTSRKQLLLATAARESMFAIYAADSGIECVAANPQVLSTTSSQTAMCNGTSIQQNFSEDFYDSPSGNSYPGYSSTFKLGLPSGCAHVTVYSFYDDSKLTTVAQSRGYNLCENLEPVVSPKIVERALQISYE